MSPVTRNLRRKKGSGARLLRDTGRLFASLNYKVGGGGRPYVVIGFSTKYASGHHDGTAKNWHGKPIPKRTIIPPTAEAKKRAVETIDRWLNVRTRSFGG